MRYIIILFCFSFLSSCGGSGSSEIAKQLIWSDPKSTASMWKATYNDGKLNSPTSNNYGNRVIYFTENADSAIIENLLANGGSVVEVIESQTFDDGTQYGKVVLELEDGTRQEIIGRFTTDASSGIYSNNDSPWKFTAASGPNVANMPVGNHSYTGFAITSFDYGTEDYSETGTFVLDANFSSGTADLLATLDASDYENKNLLINQTTGEIDGLNGNFTVYQNNEKAVILENRFLNFTGNFHGTNANHVTGLAIGRSTDQLDKTLVEIVGSR